MDSQIRAFEQSPSLPPADEAGVPMRCPRVMPVQPLQVMTPVSLLGSVLMALLFVPRAAMLAPAMMRSATRGS